MLVDLSSLILVYLCLFLVYLYMSYYHFKAQIYD